MHACNNSLEIDYNQFSFVLSWIVLLESMMVCSPWISRCIQTLVGGRRFLRVMEISELKKALQVEKNKFFSIDDFPKKAKLDRRMIKLELEEEALSLSWYIRYGLPVVLPISMKALSYTIYLILLIAYRNIPILTFRHTPWLPHLAAVVIGFPTGVEGGLGCVYVILVVKNCYHYLLRRVIESSLSRREKND